MAQLESEFLQWVLKQRVDGVAATMLEDDRICFNMPTATAEVNFYPFENSHIVELRVVRTSNGDSTFFLHFDLAATGIEHACELFGEMSDALTAEAGQGATRVLLTCTSAFTTSMFAAKMNDVAQTLKLEYEFEALSLDLALATTETYAAIMLAPQATYARTKMADAHPEAIVFEIPGKVFGSYDAAAAIGLLMHALREVETPGEQKTPLKAVRDLSDDRRVLVITLFSLMGAARLGWRLYERGECVAQGVVRKRRLNMDDVGDLIQMLSVSQMELSTLDAIGVAVPGVTYRGIVNLPMMGIEFYNLGLDLTERFLVPVYVDNNCNAAAVGCYVSQDEAENLVFYRHAFGHPAGGMGTVIDGRILKGRFNFAGESMFFGQFFDYGLPPEDAVWVADGLRDIAKYVSLSAISILAPDALYLAVDTIDDPDDFAALLSEVLEKQYVPAIHIVTDYVERVYLGTLAMALQKLRDPRYRSLAVHHAPDSFAHETWVEEWERLKEAKSDKSPAQGEQT